MEPIRIAIVEDQHLTRQGLSALIKTVEGLELIMEAANGKDFLQLLEGCSQLPHIVLSDMSMPGMTGMELNDALRQQYPAIKLIALSVYSQERVVSKMINAGASAYLNKSCEATELITAIRAVHQTGFYINQETLKAIQNVADYRNKKVKHLDAVPVELTNREKQVLEYICKEYSNTEIADQLALSVRTVEGHRNSLLLKTGCKNTAGLVIFAVKHGVFEVL
jgi:DNA-binding NarL/FixJ family response regulator